MNQSSSAQLTDTLILNFRVSLLITIGYLARGLARLFFLLRRPLRRPFAAKRRGAKLCRNLKVSWLIAAEDVTGAAGAVDDLLTGRLIVIFECHD